MDKKDCLLNMYLDNPSMFYLVVGLPIMIIVIFCWSVCVVPSTVEGEENFQEEIIADDIDQFEKLTEENEEIDENTNEEVTENIDDSAGKSENANLRQRYAKGTENETD